MKNMTRVAALVAAAALVLSGCSVAGGSTGESKAGGTLTILTSQTQVTLDPAKSQGLATTFLGLVTRRLTTWKLSPTGTPEVVPDLATTTGTPSEDGTSWTYTLKSGITLSDGSPLTSQDIKHGVERSFASELSGGLSYHKSLLVGADTYTGPFTGGELASIETPDAQTIRFHLKSAYGDWPWIVSMAPFSPVPAEGDDPAHYGENPVASGPYRVASVQQGTAITLERNPEWSASTDSVRTVGPDRVVLKMSQELATSAQSLIADTGEARTSFSAQYLGAAQLAQLRHNPSVQKRVVTSDAGPLTYLAMNTQSRELQDVRVRQAVQYAIDRKAFIVASGGSAAATAATTLITPGIPGRVDYDLYPAGAEGDVAKAKALLNEAGHASGPRFTLLTTNDAAALAQAQAIQQGLQRVGITVTISPKDPASYLNDSSSGTADYDLNLGSWQPDFPSANANIQPLFDSSQIGGGGYNLSRYASPEVDALIAQATAEADPHAAEALWAQTDRRIMQDAPVVPLIYAKQSFLAGSGVQDFFVPSFPAYPNYLSISLR